MFGIYCMTTEKFLDGNKWVHEVIFASKTDSLDEAKKLRSKIKRTDLLIVEIDGPDYWVID